MELKPFLPNCIPFPAESRRWQQCLPESALWPLPERSYEEIDLVRVDDLGLNSCLIAPVGSEALIKSVAELGLGWMLLNKLPGETK